VDEHRGESGRGGARLLASGKSARWVAWLGEPTAPRTRPVAAWLTAPCAVALAYAVHRALLPQPGVAPFVFFYSGVVAASWLGGRGPGLLAVLLSALAGNYFFLEPQRGWSMNAPALHATLMFMLGSGAIAVCSGSFRAALIRGAQTSDRLRRLADASLRIIERTDLGGMLEETCDAALAMTEARVSAASHLLADGGMVVRASPGAMGARAGSLDEMFRPDAGGVHMDLVNNHAAIRWTDAELRAHPRWRGLPQHHVPLRGLLGVPILGLNGKRAGMILVSDRRGGDFTAEDESLLQQLATVASLSLQHIEARMSLEAADRRKDEFLAVLSHELRNPLAPIKNSLYLLDRVPPGGPKALRARAVIEHQVAHMTRLVADLLDVSRISRGKVELRREQMDLAAVVSRTVEDHRTLFAARRIALHDAAPVSPVWVHGDAVRLAQVLGNLLHNAAKFTQPGGRVDVQLDEEEGQARLRVRDTGMGIPAEALATIFEPFIQGKQGLDRGAGGLGLGLALVKGLVEMHDGTILARSEGAGRGAELEVHLPAVPPAAPYAPPPERETGGAPPRRVLVIEDNLDAAESLREVLLLSEHRVEVAHDGPSGIEIARALAPEVVLCDIGLPGMDGYAVARAFRADDTLRGCTLVALTGYALADDRQRALAAGYDEHLAKPPDLAALEKVLAAMPLRRTA
jgi:signal transduction histidine kinase/CheY-like chemotaxis protein